MPEHILYFHVNLPVSYFPLYFDLGMYLYLPFFRLPLGFDSYFFMDRYIMKASNAKAASVPPIKMIFSIGMEVSLYLVFTESMSPY